MRLSFNSGVGLALIISLAIDQIFCFAPSINPPIEPVVSRTKQTSIRGLDGAGTVLSANAVEQVRSRARSFSVVFIVLLVGDFVSGVVEREQDVGAKRQPGRGLGILFEEIEVGFGIELDVLALPRVLRVAIDPLLSVLKEGATVHELRLLGVQRDTIRLRRRGRGGESQTAR